MGVILGGVKVKRFFNALGRFLKWLFFIEKIEWFPKRKPKPEEKGVILWVARNVGNEFYQVYSSPDRSRWLNQWFGEPELLPALRNMKPGESKRIRLEVLD